MLAAVLACCTVSAVCADGNGNRPETWFHLIGGNVTKAGLRADLEAVKRAGIGGIQFFHGRGARWDDVPEQIQCLSEKWDDLVRFTAQECARLGLTFRIQNCPGWSMSGGPWIKPSHAMRKLTFARRDFTGGTFDAEIPVPKNMRDAESDWQDVTYLAFPTPQDDTGTLLEPVETVRKGHSRTFRFAEPVTVRTLELPSPSDLNHFWCYNPDTRVVFTAHTPTGDVTVCAADYPQGCWQDRVPFSLACSEASATRWTLALTAPHWIDLKYVRLHAAARLDNWEGKSGNILRGFVTRRPPVRPAAQKIATDSIRVVKQGDRLGPGSWTVLRIGHVNMKKKNGPAPAEATGWECDKLDPRGAEAHFAGYVGRLLDGPLAGGLVRGMLIDSWECERQTWTWKMESYFRAANGYELRRKLPALFGWIVDDETATEDFLRDWRRTLSDLICTNYYGKLAELARARGLDVTWETAMGDVVPGDPLAYWKDCDTPMCEFWHPYTPATGFVGHPNFKPVKSCVSAARLYGKKRVAAEAFTSTFLSWNETPRILREQAVRHLAQGVTHFVFHTYTHNPHTDGRVPGSSFGSCIGSPFLKTQTWWDFMPAFTDWLTDCGRFLERGHAAVDVLRYLGDEYAHRPDECEPFPAGYAYDYLNQDVLLTRLDVRDGVFVLPDGPRYARIWIPDGTYLAPKTRTRLAALAAKGGTVVYGDAEAAVRGLPPQVTSADGSPLAGAAAADLLWLHRTDRDADLYFLAATSNGFRGRVTLATARGPKTVSLAFDAFESANVTIGPDGVSGLPTPRLTAAATDLSHGWTLSFPSGWGAPASRTLDRLYAWKDIPGMSEEGRAFSGTARYTRTWTCAETPTGRVELDLGDVRDAARVYVNGREAAVLWSRPFRCDIGAFLKKGANELRVDVTSPWYNRLAYDKKQPAAARKTWTVWDIRYRTPPCLMPDAELLPSGMLGPVLLRTERRLTVTAQPVERTAKTAAGDTLHDFGKDAFGWLEIESPAGGAYELVLGELTDTAGCVTNAYRGSTIRAVRVKGDAKPGRFRVPLIPDHRNTHGPAESPAVRLDPAFGVVMPFRYVQAVSLPADARLVRQVLHWPVDMEAASFTSDSPVLNRVWDFCKYSIWATTFAGLYVDGDRERIPYEADAYINQLGHYAVDADYTMARRTHEYLLRVPTWPTEWKQHSIKMAWADWMWSGDQACLARTYDTLVKEKLHAGFATRADGLLVTSGAARRGPRDIVDWPLAERDGYEFKKVNTVVNAFYYANLLEMADLASAVGRPEDAARFRAEAVRVRAAFDRAFYDVARGVYTDGEGSRHASLHANAAALAFGLVPPARHAALVRFLDGKGMACSVYFAQYLLEAYCRAGREDLALKYITASGDRSWQGMMDFGSTITMEAWNMKAKPNQDLNHAWGAPPINIVSRFILGVTPLEPGFRRISVAPRFAGLKRVSARVPTAAGTVAITWRDDVLTLDVPAPTRLAWGDTAYELAPGLHVIKAD